MSEVFAKIVDRTSRLDALINDVERGKPVDPAAIDQEIERLQRLPR